MCSQRIYNTFPPPKCHLPHLDPSHLSSCTALALWSPCSASNVRVLSCLTVSGLTVLFCLESSSLIFAWLAASDMLFQSTIHWPSSLEQGPTWAPLLSSPSLSLCSNWLPSQSTWLYLFLPLDFKFLENRDLVYLLHHSLLSVPSK